jgi:predicted AAA-ATPase
MGRFVNPDNSAFQVALNSRIYVDKTGLINFTNSVLDTMDGYQVYNPKAVVSLMTKGKFRSYWSETGSYEVVVPLICMNFDGLKTAIIEMLSGAEVEVNTASFKNDPAKIQNRDDVITYLIHLGYLGYNEENGTAFVPNEEIRQELSTAVRNSHWNEMITFQQESRKLLMATRNTEAESHAVLVRWRKTSRMARTRK